MIFTTCMLFIGSAYAVLLPNPTGPFWVAVSVNTLTDATHMDPFAPDDMPQHRRVLISTFIPLNITTAPCVSRATPYMTPLVAGDYDILAGSVGLPNTTFASLTMQLCDVPRHAFCSRVHSDQYETAKTPRPLVLFSPGFGQSRLLYGAMARSLASEGYIVVTVNHPYDATVIEFTDGSFVRAANISTDDETALEMVIQVRVADISFVIDQLQNSTTLRQPIENGASTVDFDRIIMCGHSLGGAASAATMLTESRILGGIDLDGRFFSPVTEIGVDRPFLEIGRPNHHDEDPTWDEFYNHTGAERIEISINATNHSSFTDYPAIMTALNLTDTAKESLQDFLGTGDWAGIDGIIKSLVRAFGTFLFEGTVLDILRGSDANFFEVEIVCSNL
ncbi:hypothetical protein SUNI508_06658 [Seiridium unicorne]|uniref:1-alkyl-2-acetylglycerophosphocholine esterase n=1 Tax=Seiridium unicorne TaxID=138068 RepID=A0ABR2UZL2_9PEZI